MKFGELSEHFPTQNIDPYGECIVVPGDQFDPDWEDQLGDQGFICHNCVVGNKPVTLIPTKKLVATGKTAYVKPREKPKLPSKDLPEKKESQVNWPDRELSRQEKMICDAWNEGLTRPEIYLRLKAASPHCSVSYHIQKLMKEGVLISRHKKKRLQQQSVKRIEQQSVTPVAEVATASEPMFKDLADVEKAFNNLMEAVAILSRDNQLLREENIEIKAKLFAHTHSQQTGMPVIELPLSNCKCKPC